MARMTIRDAVDGRDGPLGAAAGTREAVGGREGHEPAYVLVRLRGRFGLAHTTYLVPLAWVKDALPHAPAARDTRDAVARAWAVRGVLDVPDHTADDEAPVAAVTQALTRDPLTRMACLRVVSWLGDVASSGALPAAAGDRAAAVALGVPGVTRVRNRTTVTSAVPP